MPLAPLNPNCWSFCRNLSHFQSVLYTDTRSLQNRSKHARVRGDHSLPLPRSLPKPTEYKVPFLRSFEKATSTPTCSLHKGVTHLIGETGRKTAYMAIFEEPSTQAGASLLPLLPSWGTWVRREGLGSRSSAIGRSLCVQWAQSYFWSSIWMAGEVLLSKPNLSTPRTNSGGRHQKAPMVPNPNHAFQSCFTNNTADILMSIRLPCLFLS